MKFYYLIFLVLAGCSDDMSRTINEPNLHLSYKKIREKVIYKYQNIAPNNLHRLLEKLAQNKHNGRRDNHIYFPIATSELSTQRLRYLKDKLLEKGFSYEQFKIDKNLKSEEYKIDLKIKQYDVSVIPENTPGEAILQNKILMMEDLSVLFKNKANAPGS